MGVFITLTGIAVHVTRVCRTRSASRLSRPGAGYPRSEGSGAKFEVYLIFRNSYSCQSPKSRTGRYVDATPSPLCRRNSVTTLSVSLWSSLPLTGDRIIGLGLASALKHTYTLQHNPTAATWLSTRAVYRYSTPRHAQRRLERLRACSLRAP